MPSLLFSSKHDKIPGLASARRFFSKASGLSDINVHTMSYAADTSTPPSSPSVTDPTPAEAPPYQPPAITSPENNHAALPGLGNAQHASDSDHHLDVSSSAGSNLHISLTSPAAPVRRPYTAATLRAPPRSSTAEIDSDYFKHRRRYHHSEVDMRLSPSITLVRPSPLPLPALPTLPPIHLTLPSSQGQNLGSVPSLYHTADDRPAPEDGEEMDDSAMSEGDDGDDAASDVSGTGSSGSVTRSTEAAGITIVIPNLSPSSSPAPPARPRGTRRLPPVLIVPPIELPCTDAYPDVQTETATITPKGDSSTGDYFSTPVPQRSSAQTPRPVDFNTSPVENSEPSNQSPTARRPNLYQHASRSMIDLGTLAIPASSQSGPLLKSTPLTPVPAETQLPSAGASRAQATLRRRSLPDMAKAPPPYTALFPIHPRDDEGCEKLPAYGCGVHIEGILHRKMEFSRPGIQARDRSWRKLFFVLNGTSLRVYKADPRKVAIKNQITLDRTRSAGIQIDCTRMETESEVDISAPHVHFPIEAMSPTSRRKALAALTKASTARRQSQQQILQWQAGETRPQTPTQQAEERAVRRASSNSFASGSRLSASFSGSILAVSGPSPAPANGSSFNFSDNNTAEWLIAGAKRASDEPAGASISKAFPPVNSPVSSSPTSSRFSLHGPFSSGNMLLRQYTLQHAESGLGSDYLKRRNVMRVRAEGEQFLLQAESVMDVVNWIEAFQAATNVALDLDERTMPKVPSLPRRRRRRRARPPPTDAPVLAEERVNSHHH